MTGPADDDGDTIVRGLDWRGSFLLPTDDVVRQLLRPHGLRLGPTGVLLCWLLDVALFLAVGVCAVLSVVYVLLHAGAL